MGCIIGGFVCVLVLILVASATSVGLLIAMATKAETALEAAPVMIQEFIDANADQFIAEHITRVMPEIVQNAVLALMMGEMNGASTTGAVDGAAGGGSATGAATAADALPRGDRHQYHRSIAGGDCGVSSSALCQAFKKTCADYRTCRAERTSAACMPFVNDMAYVCSINRCDVYTDRTTCDRVNNLCINRRAALINPRARAFMEQELVDLCTIVV